MINDSFRAENNGKIRPPGSRSNEGPRAFEERGVGRRHRLAHSPVAGNKAFRKADDGGVLGGGLSDSAFG